MVITASLLLCYLRGDKLEQSCRVKSSQQNGVAGYTWTRDLGTDSLRNLLRNHEGVTVLRLYCCTDCRTVEGTCTFEMEQYNP